MTTKTLFVSATGTGVGKSHATAMLLSAAKKKGIKAAPFKPIETGVEDVAEDATMLLGLYNELYGGSAFGVEDIAPYRFPLPAAPYVASGGADISFEPINEALNRLQQVSDVVVIEGAGGLFVPIGLDFFMIDLAQKYASDMFFVSHAGLGCINDVLLSKQALDKAGINYEIFFNERDGDMFERLSKPFLSKYMQETKMLTEQSVDDFWDRFFGL